MLGVEVDYFKLIIIKKDGDELVGIIADNVYNAVDS